MSKGYFNGILRDLTSEEEVFLQETLKYASTVIEARVKKRDEALTFGKSLYQSVDPIEGDPASYLVLLKADWVRMKAEVQLLTTVDAIGDYTLTFTPVP